LTDASFIWTEPHSKRIKVKLTVQKEVAQGAILQQTFIVEFTVFNQICDECQRVEAKDYWKALVQVRQRVCVLDAFDDSLHIISFLDFAQEDIFLS
jgi:nonsense-mediated mRNA decay protein 3